MSIHYIHACTEPFNLSTSLELDNLPILGITNLNPR